MDKNEQQKNKTEQLESTENVESSMNLNLESSLDNAKKEKEKVVSETKQNIEYKTKSYTRELGEGTPEAAEIKSIGNEANTKIENESNSFNEKISEIKGDSSIEQKEVKSPKAELLNSISQNYTELESIKKELSKDKNNLELKQKLEEKKAEIESKEKGEYKAILKEEIKRYKQENPNASNKDIEASVIHPGFRELKDAKLSTLPQKEPNAFVKGLAKINKILPENKIARKIILTTITAGVTTAMIGASGATVPIAAGMFALKVARIAVTSHLGEKIGEFVSEKIIHNLDKKQNNIDSEHDNYLESFRKIEKQKIAIEKAGKYLGIISGLVLSGAMEIKLEEIIKGLEGLASNAASHGAHGAVEVAGHAAHSSHGIGSVAIHEIKQGIIDTATEKTVEKSEEYHERLAA
jgi:hypothetical protein